IQVFDRNTPKIRAFNPNLDEDGWVCPCTLLVVLQRDMPFLVDSIRIELNRRNISIHSIKSTIIYTAREPGGKLTELLPYSPDNSQGGVPVPDSDKPGVDKPGFDKEACIVFEIGLRTNEQDLRDLAVGVNSVLAEVDIVVA